MKFHTQDDPPRMVLTASDKSEEHTLRQNFKLAKDGDTITLTRCNKPTQDNPDAFEVSFIAPPVIKKPKKKIGGDK